MTTKLDLVEALSRCPCLDTPEKRALLQQQLPEVIKLTITQHNEIRSFALELVTTCLKYSDGLERLLEAVELCQPKDALETLDLRQKISQSKRPDGASDPLCPDCQAIVILIKPPILPDPVKKAFCVEGWLYEGMLWRSLLELRDQFNETCQPDELSGKTSFVEAELGSVIGELVTIGMLSGEHSRTRIEIILPLELLNHAVDDWPVEDAGNLTELGKLVPVVIRPFERIAIRQKNLRGTYAFANKRWRNKWDELQKSTAAERRYWLDETHTDPQSIRTTLENNSLVFMAANLGESPGAVVKAVVDAGIPVALWLRKSAGNGVAREFLEQLLGSADCLESPWKVFAARKDPAKANGLGFHLLWDNPNIIPEVLKVPSLGAPASIPAPQR